MNKLAEKISKNPYFAITGWLLTFIAFIIAIVVPIVQARKVSISFSYTTNLLVTDSLSEVDDLEVSFKGEKINQLSVTSCRLVNDGNVIIEDDDIYPQHKITIQPKSEDTNILFAKVVDESYDTIGSKVSYDEKKATFLFDTMEKGDEVEINIYHTGKADDVFLIDGKIKDGRIRSNSINFVLIVPTLMIILWVVIVGISLIVPRSDLRIVFTALSLLVSMIAAIVSVISVIPEISALFTNG